MTNVSTLRLNLLRPAYLLLAIGLGLKEWPGILDPASAWQLNQGVIVAMLGAIGALAFLGLRYPLQMLPLLFFELAWKTIWLARIALPLALGQGIDAATAETVKACLLVVVLLPVIPWDYVWATYVRRPAEPWRRHTAPHVPRLAG